MGKMMSAKVSSSGLNGGIPRANNLLPRAVRNAVLDADRHHCVFCGATDGLQIDHIVPRAVGGSDDFGNLVTLCKSDNQIKSDYYVGADGKITYRTFGTFSAIADKEQAAKILAAECRAMRSPLRHIRLLLAKRRYGL